MAEWPPGPSVSTPFFRRFFVDEQAQELKQTQALYERVRARHQAFCAVHPDAVTEITDGVLDYLDPALPGSVAGPLVAALEAVIRSERYIFELPPPEFERYTVAEFVQFRTFLRAKEYFFDNQATILQLLHECLVRLFCGIGDVLPASEGPSPFTIPLMHGVPGPHLLIDQTFNTLCEDQYRERNLLYSLTDRLYRNYCAANDMVPHQETKKVLKGAVDADLPTNELTQTYFGGTPFEDLFAAPVPLKFTQEDRFHHMHVLGGTGAGKTQLLQNLILHDLQSDDPPSLVVVDGQGDLIRNLSHLKLLEKFSDRFVLITPKDIRHPPAINIFDINRERLGGYDEETKEQVVAGVIQTFDYLFGGLLGADLTAKQGVFFRFVARLMLALPETIGRNATILDMLALMDNAAPYQKAIQSLPPIQRQFFERDFASKTFAQTKEQIRYRLNAILENPTLERLFTAEETKIDLFTALNRGSIILVDTAKDFLKGASSHFGRIFISLILQAIFERAAIPENERKPTFLVVDEAAQYFDSNIDDLLTEARKYKLGCVFAHQFLDQATSSLRASLAANTSIKFAGGVSVSDAKAMAPEMRTTADFITSQPRLHFACHIRNVTQGAVSIPIPVGELEHQPRLTTETYERLREMNRQRVCQALVGSPPLALGEDMRLEPSQVVEDPTAASENW